MPSSDKPGFDTAGMGEAHLAPEPIALEPAFQLTVELSRRELTRTVHGGRVFAPVAGGRAWGPRLQAELVGGSGAEFGLVRADAVEDMMSRWMLRAADGTDIFMHQTGYRRPDGYIRTTPFFDAPRDSPHAWLNNTLLIGVGRPAGPGAVTFAYHALR